MEDAQQFGVCWAEKQGERVQGKRWRSGGTGSGCWAAAVWEEKARFDRYDLQLPFDVKAPEAEAETYLG